MTLRKRLRVLWALMRQSWHQQTCSECQATWWAIGPAHPELIRICDDCEIQWLGERFEHALRQYEQRQDEYARHIKGARS